MIEIKNDHFSIEQIWQSGQCFRLMPTGESEDDDGRINRSYALVAFDRYLEILQHGKFVELSCSQEDFDSIWKEYFDLDEDYGRLIASIDQEDTYLLGAAEFGSGIRILKQDLWEIIISFIISQQNNIKRIRKCIQLLCEKYGEEKQTDQGTCYYAFPTPQALAQASIEDLYACNLGYRSRYIKESAASIAFGEINLDMIRQMEYIEAKQELLKLHGVGKKVADCICLFALHQTDAFPIDTHIEKVLTTRYPKGFPFEKYFGYAGSLQQYIFYYDLNVK